MKRNIETPINRDNGHERSDDQKSERRDSYQFNFPMDR